MSDSPETRTLPASIGPGDVLKRYWYLIVVLLIAAGGFGYWWRFYAFNDIGYAPLQPIPYSHKLHAGELGIDCKYCHFNAERGKHAGAPPVSVCMGCHAPDKGAAAPDSEKIAKLLELTAEANGYDSNDDYDHMDPDVVKTGGVIHWNRVHKLQDHAIFSHEWHVAAGVACQTCHGPIEDMEVVYQHASLEMGWCIDCHRDTNYVGGRDYDGTAESFTVGTANYDILRQRIRPDDVVHFHERPTAQNSGDHGDHDHADADHGHDHQEDHGETLRGLFPEHGRNGNDEGNLTNRLYLNDAQADELNRLFKEFRGEDGRSTLPRWRIPDLPEVHARFYHDPSTWDKDGDGQVDPDFIAQPGVKLGTLQNAPTQCNTCHQ